MKRSPFQLNFRLTAMAAVLAISACGGDGGGGFTPPEIPNTPITIDNSNESAVIGTATTSTSSAMGAGLTVDPTAPIATTQALKAANLVQSSMAGTSIDPQVVNSATQACAQGGSVTITLDSSVQPSNTYTPAPGDTLTMTANNCQSSDNISGLTTVNGTVSVTFNQVSITDVSVSFNGFSVTEQGSTATIHGDIRIIEDTVNSTSSISGNSLYLLSDQGDIRLTKYSISSESFTDGIGSGTIVNASYGVDSSVLGGHLDIAVTNVTKYDADQYASSGTIEITGGNMIITITIDSNTQVTITRTDLGGTPDPVNPQTTVNWADL